MKLFTLFLTILCAPIMAQTNNTPAKQPEKKAAVVAQPYRHIVLLQFKEKATPEQIKNLETLFAALPNKIDTITGFEWGTNVSPENLAQGYTHCFLVTFKDKAGLEKYIPHAEHQKFVEQLKPLIEQVLVFDFVGK